MRESRPSSSWRRCSRRSPTSSASTRQRSRTRESRRHLPSWRPGYTAISSGASRAPALTCTTSASRPAAAICALRLPGRAARRGSRARARRGGGASSPCRRVAPGPPRRRALRARRRPPRGTRHDARRATPRRSSRRPRSPRFPVSPRSRCRSLRERLAEWSGSATRSRASSRGAAAERGPAHGAHRGLARGRGRRGREARLAAPDRPRRDAARRHGVGDLGVRARPARGRRSSSGSRLGWETTSPSKLRFAVGPVPEPRSSRRRRRMPKGRPLDVPPETAAEASAAAAGSTIRSSVSSSPERREQALLRARSGRRF